jgi:hypothetical protein
MDSKVSKQLFWRLGKRSAYIILINHGTKGNHIKEAVLDQVNSEITQHCAHNEERSYQASNLHWATDRKQKQVSYIFNPEKSQQIIENFLLTILRTHERWNVTKVFWQAPGIHKFSAVPTPMYPSIYWVDWQKKISKVTLCSVAKFKNSRDAK